MKYDAKWEQIIAGDFTTHRLMVHGGWIVKVVETSYHAPASGYTSQEEHFSVSTVFGPDPNPAWEV